MFEDAPGQRDTQAELFLRDLKDDFNNSAIANHPESQTLRNSMIEQRTIAARRGVALTSFKKWFFDGQTPTEQAKNLMEAMDDRLFTLNSGAKSKDPNYVEGLKEIYTLLERREFLTDPLLKKYKENWTLPRCEGILRHNALMEIAEAASLYRLSLEKIKNGKGNQVQLKQVHELASKSLALLDSGACSKTR